MKSIPKERDETMKMFCLLLILFCATAKAEEGFFSIDELKDLQPERLTAFLPTDAGALVRIHNREPIYLSALHVILDSTDRVNNWTVVSIGPDFVFKPKNLVGLKFSLKDLITNVSTRFEGNFGNSCSGRLGDRKKKAHIWPLD